MIEPDTRYRLLSFFQRNTPFGICFLFLLLSLFPLPLFGRFPVPFILIPVFYWGLFFPVYLSPARIFWLGLLGDLITENVFGVGILCLTAFYLLIMMERRFLKDFSFVGQWIVFSLYAFLVLWSEWFLSSILQGNFFSFWGVLGRIVLLSVFYPIIVSFLGRLDDYLEEEL